MARIEDEWHSRFRDMTEVPFPESLRQRIQSRVRDGAPFDADSRSSNRSTDSAWQFRLQPWIAAVSGFCILACMVWGVWSWKGAATAHLQHNAPLAITTVDSRAGVASESRRNVPFGLSNAPLSMSNVGIGSEPGYAAGSFVVANLTNLGTSPLHEGQTFGVLWFSKSPVRDGIQASDWASFVDFHLQNGQKELAPGDSGQWSFRPVGAPMDGNGRLTQRPHLAFYQAGLVTRAQADVVWPQANVRIDGVRVTERKHWDGGQSVQVSANVTNLAKQPISLAQVLAIVWFSKAKTSDWTQPDVVRFMDNPTPFVSRDESLYPDKTVGVYFRLIGSAQTDFLGMIPHVSFIQR